MWVHPIPDPKEASQTAPPSHDSRGVVQPRRPSWEVFTLTLLLLTVARWRGVPRLLGNLPCQWWPVRAAGGPAEAQEMLVNIGRMLDARSKRLPFRLIPRLGRNICLAKALLAAWYSRQMGFPISLHFGVRMAAAGDLKGHSWVSLPSGTIWQDEGFTDIYSWHNDGSAEGTGPLKEAKECGH